MPRTRWQSVVGIPSEFQPVDHNNIRHTETYITQDAITTHEGGGDPHTGYQLESEKDAANGYAGLNASERTAKGVDTTDDIIINLATKGLVLKDTQGTPHYWRVTITTLGVLTTADLGTVKP